MFFAHDFKTMKVKVNIISSRQLLILIEKRDVKSLKFNSLSGIKISFLTRVILSTCNFKSYPCL